MRLAPQEGHNYFQPFVCRFIITPPQPVNTRLSSSCCVLCATHCCEIRQRGGVSLSASRVAAGRAAPSEDLRCAERARLVVWFYQQTVKNVSSRNRFPPDTESLWSVKWASTGVWGKVRVKMRSVCQRRWLHRRPWGHQAVFDARVTCEKLLGMTKVDTFRLVERVFPRGKWRKVTLDSLRTLR